MGIPENDREEAQAARDADEHLQDDERPTAAELAEEDVVDVDVVEDGDGPHPELAEAVDGAVGVSAELAVRDPQDTYEGLLAMDAHDVDKLLDDVTRQVQKAALRKWVYQLPGQGNPTGLTVHAVEDITQRMNWTGKCAIKVLPGTLRVEKEEVDGESGREVWFVATVFAEDAKTGAVLPGTSSEPQMMQLKKDTADAKRREGKQIREDNRVFDRFARSKAVGKATRNAMGSFIPMEVEQTVIAMATNRPGLVERIQTEAEEKAAEWPAPLQTPKAVELRERAEAIYSEIRELGGGAGKLKLPPGQYASYLLQSQHDETLLERMIDWLLQRKETIEGEVAS